MIELAILESNCLYSNCKITVLYVILSFPSLSTDGPTNRLTDMCKAIIPPLLRKGSIISYTGHVLLTWNFNSSTSTDGLTEYVSSFTMIGAYMSLILCVNKPQKEKLSRWRQHHPIMIFVKLYLLPILVPCNCWCWISWKYSLGQKCDNMNKQLKDGEKS